MSFLFLCCCFFFSNKYHEILNNENLLKICLKFTYPTNVCMFCSSSYYGKNEYIRFFKTNKYNKNVYVYILTTNGFTLNHIESLQVYFFCVKRQAKKKKKKKKKKRSLRVFFLVTVPRHFCSNASENPCFLVEDFPG